MAEDTQIITIDDECYPPLLKEVYSPPKQLYVQGNVDLLRQDKLLAVVGSRKGNAYGQQAIKKLLTPIVQAGIPLVSGLAYGIDSMAHRLCLELNTPTIAVLGSGLDSQSLYPHQHINLAHQIGQSGGAVITEHPAGTRAQLYHFPARNRIIAGLCSATLVIQATNRSGSLITARLALESGKDVLAVPGAITDPLAAGTNLLIQQGAMPALTPQDILDLYELKQEPLPLAKLELTANQQKIIKLLSSEPIHIDAVVRQSKLPPPIVSATLIELEMLDAVHNTGGMKYIKS